MDQSYSNTYEDSRKLGKHLTLDERGSIQALHCLGISLRGIAAQIGCAHTTVMYELRRGTPKRTSSRGRLPYTRLNVDKMHTRNIARIAANRVSSMTIYLNRLFNGSSSKYVKSVGLWMYASVMPNCIICF